MPYFRRLFSQRIYAEFREKLNGDRVVFYERDYLELRDGKKGKHNRHPELKSHFEFVKKAIENPLQVNEDKGGDGKLCYYTAIGLDKVYKGKYMKVVIGSNWYGKLQVVTVHVRSSYQQSGEKKIWPI